MNRQAIRKPFPRLVETEQPIDVTALLRAEIKQRDWAACHIAGDKRKPLPFFERVKRTWRA